MNATVERVVPALSQLSDSREAVVLLHASASSAKQWRELDSALATRYRVQAVELHGCGNAPDWPGIEPIRMRHEAERVIACLGDEPLHVVGHSFGGAVAMRLAVENPERIRSLTLIEPVAFHLLREGTDSDHMLYREITRLASTVSRAVLAGDLHGGMAQFIDYWNGSGAWQRMSDSAREAMARKLPSVVLNFRAALTERLPVSVYATLGVPIRLIRGERSPATTRRIVELLACGIRGAAVFDVPGAGHMSPIFHPDAVNDAIARHLAHSASGRRQAA